MARIKNSIIMALNGKYVESSTWERIQEGFYTSFLGKTNIDFFQQAVKKPAAERTPEETGLLTRIQAVAMSLYPNNFPANNKNNKEKGTPLTPLQQLHVLFVTELSLTPWYGAPLQYMKAFVQAALEIPNAFQQAAVSLNIQLDKARDLALAKAEKPITRAGIKFRWFFSKIFTMGLLVSFSIASFVSHAISRFVDNLRANPKLSAVFGASSVVLTSGGTAAMATVPAVNTFAASVVASVPGGAALTTAIGSNPIGWAAGIIVGGSTLVASMASQVDSYINEIEQDLEVLKAPQKLTAVAIKLGQIPIPAVLLENEYKSQLETAMRNNMLDFLSKVVVNPNSEVTLKQTLDYYCNELLNALTKKGLITSSTPKTLINELKARMPFQVLTYIVSTINNQQRTLEIDINLIHNKIKELFNGNTNDWQVIYNQTIQELGIKPEETYSNANFYQDFIEPGLPENKIAQELIRYEVQILGKQDLGVDLEADKASNTYDLNSLNDRYESESVSYAIYWRLQYYSAKKDRTSEQETLVGLYYSYLAPDVFNADKQQEVEKKIYQSINTSYTASSSSSSSSSSSAFNDDTNGNLSRSPSRTSNNSNDDKLHDDKKMKVAADAAIDSATNYRKNAEEMQKQLQLTNIFSADHSSSDYKDGVFNGWTKSFSNNRGLKFNGLKKVGQSEIRDRSAPILTAPILTK